MCALPILEGVLFDSDITKVEDSIPKYEVESKLFGTNLTCWAYTYDLKVTSDGYVVICLHWHKGCKNSYTPSYIGKPFHFIKDGILYALKNNKQMTIDGFALNHELFSLDWTDCYILHPYKDDWVLFSCSREKWLNEGKAEEKNQEMQVYMEIKDYEKLSLESLPQGGLEWLDRCLK
jgi:hypothetical protein